LFSLFEQPAAATKTAKMNTVSPAVTQQPRQQHELSFRAADLKTVEQEQDLRF